MSTPVGTITGVASSGSSVTILEANQKREMATFFNRSTQILYLNFAGATATAASGGSSVEVASGGYFELPITSRGVYRGKITGIWASANGFVNATEFTSGV